MTRGTTPTIILNLGTALPLADMKEIWVTVKNLVHERTYTKDELSIVDNTLVVQLTQEDTLKFCEGDAEVQVRLLNDSGKAYASNIKVLPVKRILKEGVIS